MKCAYCKTEISFYHWILYFGKCYHCNERIENNSSVHERWVKEHKRQEKDSNKYWEDKTEQ